MASSPSSVPQKYTWPVTFPINSIGPVTSPMWHTINNNMMWFCELKLCSNPSQLSALSYSIEAKVQSCMNKIRVAVKLTVSPWNINESPRKAETEGLTIAGQKIGSTMNIPSLGLAFSFNIDVELTLLNNPADKMPPIIVQSQLIPNLASMLLSGKHSDLKISVGGEEFPAHKAILAARSPVFAAMFDHEMEESKQNRLPIEDIEPNVLKGLLEFIYTDTVTDMDAIAYELLPAANKYFLTKLKAMCENSLGRNLSIDTATKIFVAADVYAADRLKKHTLSFIIRNKEVMETADWKEMWTTRPDLLNEVLLEVMKTK